MDIALVILNWNGEALLEKYLPSVLDYSNRASIHLIDNASTDGSIALVKEKFPSINIVENPYNGGFAAGYNMGLKSI
ncbi:MAG: glycosyltransferase, partial [Bacteroidota bacterium]